jgi:hypothetical protein
VRPLLSTVMIGALSLLAAGPSLAQGKEDRKEACRAEARLIYSGSGGDREQKKAWRKAAIKACMQRSAGRGSGEGSSQGGGDKEVRREACRDQARNAYYGAELKQQRKAYVKSCMQKGRSA